MKSSLKDRTKLSIIVIILLSLLSIFGYMSLNPVIATYMPGIKIVNDEEIDMYKKRNTAYAYKVNEDNKFLVKYNTFNNDELCVTTLSLSSEQYNELVDGEYYWFKVKFQDSNDTVGTIKQIYTDNPRGR